MIKKTLKLLATMAAFGACIALIWMAQRPLQRYYEKPLPNFPLTTLEGKAFGTHDWRDGKPMVINLFASWCAPCRAEIPELQELSNYIPIYGVAVQDEPAQITKMLEKTGNPFTAVGLDSFGNFSSHLEIRGLPTTLVLDGRGQISYVQEGPIQPGETKEKLIPLVKHLF